MVPGVSAAPRIVGIGRSSRETYCRVLWTQACRMRNSESSPVPRYSFQSASPESVQMSGTAPRFCDEAIIEPAVLPPRRASNRRRCVHGIAPTYTAAG